MLDGALASSAPSGHAGCDLDVDFSNVIQSAIWGARVARLKQ